MSFKNRVATYQLIATSTLVLIVFGLIYLIVRQTVYQNIDQALSLEAYKHTEEVAVLKDTIYFLNKGEWEEREHREAQVLPVFIQLIDDGGEIMDKSPNLKDQHLSFNIDFEAGHHFDGSLNKEALRQIQIPLYHDKEVLEGYIIAAMSMQASVIVLRNLAIVELVSFPIVLLILFYLTRALADRSIAPVKEITKLAKHTSQHFLSERVPVPETKDEIHDLATAINALLDRIEYAFKGEKQFTSEASHELRTPLATLRGSLEVLIRKDRSEQEYKEVIKKALGQIDRMSLLSDQLLTLARMDSDAVTLQKKPIGIVLEEVISDLNSQIQAKSMRLDLQMNDLEAHEVPDYFSELIFRNILLNAVKYSPEESEIKIHLQELKGKILCSIEDQGPGIPKEDHEKVFEAFYRAKHGSGSELAGSGLGLSIVRKALRAIDGEIDLQSEMGRGTRFNIHL